MLGWQRASNASLWCSYQGKEQRTCVYGSEPCCYPDLLLLRALLMNIIWQGNISLWENTSPPFSATTDICSIPRWRSSFSSCHAILKAAEEYVSCWALRGSTRGQEEEDGRCSPCTDPVLCAAGPREPMGRVESREGGCGCCDGASTCCSQGKNKYWKNKNPWNGSPNTLLNSEACFAKKMTQQAWSPDPSKFVVSFTPGSHLYWEGAR